MGGSDSKDEASVVSQSPAISTDPLISRLRSTFRLKISDKQPNKTHSFIHSSFSLQIIKSNINKINPNFSPFCSIFSKDPTKSDIITCALISPIMALAPSQNICEKTGYIYLKGIVVEGAANGKKIKVKVKTTLLLKDNTLVLLTLEQPLWELGWCGLSYLQESEQINNLPLHLIKNIHLNTKNDAFEQNLSRVFCTDQGGFMGKSVRSDYGLLFEIVERKPYIKGLIVQNLAFFFDYSFIQHLQNHVSEYLKPEMQREYLKAIDLQQMEIQTSW